jgi:hypothetical protein
VLFCCTTAAKLPIAAGVDFARLHAIEERFGGERPYKKRAARA